jgi:hypothetical protein
MSFELSERAVIAIERPARYGKQLAMHLSHKCPMTETSSGWDLVIRDGEGKVIPREETLVLEAYANDAETLAIVKDVLERHLRKFASKLDPLEVNWTSGF